MSAKNENNKNNDNLQIKPTELKKKIDSGGAIIGLELAATMPEVIDFLIVYEAPLSTTSTQKVSARARLLRKPNSWHL